MFHLSKQLCKCFSRALNIRFASIDVTVPVQQQFVAANKHFLASVNIHKVPQYNPSINANIIPLRLPVDRLKWIIESPGLNKASYIDPRTNVEIEAPTSNTVDIPKQAARLIVIRRKKMKKHKLRKLRKKMKFEWAKRRQRRELRKEKAFQAGLIMQYKTAETFSAEEYVRARLDKLEEVSVQASRGLYTNSTTS